MSTTSMLDIMNEADYQIEEKAGALEDGSYEARCIWVLSLGTQSIQFKKNAKPKDVKQIMVFWEIPEEEITFECKKTDKELTMPRVVSETYTESINKGSNFRKILESWVGSINEKTFNPISLINKECMITLKSEEKEKDGEKKSYQNITAVAQLPKKTKGTLPDAKHELGGFLFFPNEAITKKLAPYITDPMKSPFPAWCLKKLYDSAEYAPLFGAPPEIPEKLLKGGGSSEEESSDKAEDAEAIKLNQSILTVLQQIVDQEKGDYGLLNTHVKEKKRSSLKDCTKEELKDIYNKLLSVLY